jgi:choloylglycine hydrolase
MDRFVRASAFLSTLNSAFTNADIKPNRISALFTAIRAITEPFGAFQFFGTAAIPAWPTLWTSLYNLTNKRVYFTHNLARNNFWIDMGKLDFSPGAPILYLNADKPGLTGEVSGLFKPVP